MRKRGFKGILAGLMAVIMLMGMITSAAAADPVYDPDKQVKLYIYVGNERDNIAYTYNAKDFANKFVLYNNGEMFSLKDLIGVSFTELFEDYVSRAPGEWCAYGASIDAEGACADVKYIGTLSESSLKYMGEGNSLFFVPKHDFTTYTNEGHIPRRFYTVKSSSLSRTISSSGVEPTYQWYRYSRQASDYFTVDGSPDARRTEAGGGWAYINYKTDGLYKSEYVEYIYSDQNPILFPVVMDLNGKAMTATDSLNNLCANNFYYELSQVGDRVDICIYALVPYYYTVMGTSVYTTPAEAMSNYSVSIEAVDGATEDVYYPSETGVYYCKLTYSDGNNTLSVNSEPVHANFKKYTVSFDANGGSGYMSSVTVGNQYILPENAFTAPAGATFKCWDVNGAEMTPGDAITVSTSVTVKALWNIVPTSYDIAFNANGGTGAMANQTVADGATAALSENTFTKEDYKFIGWNTAADGTGTNYADKASITSNLVELGETVILYAQWEYVGSYTVVFDANGGAGTMANQKISIGVEAALSQNAFTRTNFAFMGWNTSADGAGTSYADKASIVNLATAGNSITLYAIWEQRYTASFDANGGTGTMSPQVVDLSGEYTLPENSFGAPDGKRFKAWDVNGVEKMPGDTVSVTADITVTALWEDIPATYTVSFDADGGMGSMADVSGISGDYTLPASQFLAPYGKQFKCWSVNSTEMAVGETITLTADITVSAVWEDAEISHEDWYSALLILLTGKLNVTASATEGGSVTPEGVSAVVYTKDITYTITPDEGYKIKSVIVDGEDIGAVSEYTFENVKRVHSIHAVFEAITVDEPEVPACDGGDNCPMSAYTDLEAGKWYHDALHYCLENGLMQGVGDNVFDLDGMTTRAMIVTVLWRIAGSPVVNYAMDFEDVEADQWYTEAIRWAASENIVKGYGNGKFGTNDPITREQQASILYRYEQYKGGGFTGMWMMRLDFVDVADVSEYAYEAICWMNMKGVLLGKLDGSVLDPKGMASRVEAAAMIQRYCELAK